MGGNFTVMMVHVIRETMPFMIRAAVNMLQLFYDTNGLLRPSSQWAIDSMGMIREY